MQIRCSANCFKTPHNAAVIANPADIFLKLLVGKLFKDGKWKNEFMPSMFMLY